MAHDLTNIMVVLSSPSGAGKTTITKKIQQKYNSFKISVSHTTRKPRSNEVDGVDYNFVSEEKFKELIISKIPSNRLGSTEDVANVVIFLSSDLANYITGETIHVNGGMYLG